MEKRNNIILLLSDEKTQHQRTKTELEKLKGNFRQKCDETWAIYARDKEMKAVLETKKMTSDQKVEKIWKIMNETPSAGDPSRNTADNEELTKLYFENSCLVEQNAFLEQEMKEIKEQQKAELDKMKTELEHCFALDPPSPPRREAFLFSHKMHPNEAASLAETSENRRKLSAEDAREMTLLRELLWGRNISDSVFRYWSLGFNFGENEPSALVQQTGGPCSVIATCQAYILKHLMDLPVVQFKDLTEDKCRKVLVQAVCNILTNCKESTVFRIVTLDRSNQANVEKAQEADEEELLTQPPSTHDAMDTSPVTEDRGLQENDDELPPDVFHGCLRVDDFETIEEVEKFFSDNYAVLSSRYGVLLFLYSVLMTKGIEKLLSEISDTSEPLIHSAFGYGSQSLINLFLTGRAVADVFDNDQDIGGMKLKGIEKQSDIGFITLMEQLRYCTVGSYYKNPKYPVWIMASETHLTVLFSNEKQLVAPETAAETARRVFSQYDTENTGFISSSVLQDILSKLGLESDPEYVEIMRKKLDADGTTIILLNDFMYEFFPDDKKSTPDTFELFHYNGIPISNENHKVRYSHGQAIILESHTQEMFSQSNHMLTVLQTKWPNIEINWNSDRVPSLN